MWSNVVEHPAVLRFLAKVDEIKIDYSILAVLVLTLVLILLVECARHFIDHKAESKPFFKAVLTSCYSELSTLGIVEAGIFLLIAYYDALDLKKEKVFAYCHFMLFFTAIFNALQSCIQAYFAVRVSHRMWVRTEELELSHYVAIREEFEILEAKVKNLKPLSRANETVLERLGRALTRCYREITNLGTFRKYRSLLVQVRFHELRVHFLQANALPMKLKVSEYLKLSELAVLKKLVTVSAFAWILLTALVNLTYFILGMVAYVSEDANHTISIAMAWLFVGGNVFSVTFCIILYFKMKIVFYKIMKMKFIDCGVTSDRFNHQTFTMLKKKQLSLFWGSSPSYVVAMIQCCQFGYAISAGILIIFWDKIQKDAFLPATDLLIALLVCYTVFVLVLARVLPRYTMCMSLGALVDRKRLKEITARYKLEEAIAAAATSSTNEASGEETIVSESDDSSRFSVPKLSSLAELVTTKTEDLRTSHSFRLGDASESTRVQKRSVRRMKSYSDSRSIAMMRQYGRASSIPETSTENEADTWVGSVRLKTSPSLGDLSIASFDAQNSETLQIEGSPDNHVGEEGTEVRQQIGAAPLESVDAPTPSRDENSPGKTPAMWILAYAHTLQYRFVSEILGTMVAFFCVGMRVEGLLIASGEIKDYETTINFSLGISFWCETVWLIAMLCSSAFILYIAERNGSNPKLRISCFLDVFLCGLCLGLLMWSEVQRCCTDDDFESDCCGAFGSRTFGGLGNVEPFTSLIGLRVLRYYASRKLIILQSICCFESSICDTESEEHKESVHQHGHGRSLQTKKATIAELWREAITAHSDIVSAHGEFSGELLKAMLGVRVEAVGQRSTSNNNTANNTPRVTIQEPVNEVIVKTYPLISDEFAVYESNSLNDLVKPDAKLILPMRRCDWMLPPLVDHWRAVDVVMTEKEIVLLEAIDLETPSNGQEKQTQHITQRILAATRGGKDVRLRDAVVGRKILGHVDLSAVDMVTVERYPPTLSKEFDVDRDHELDLLKDEYWEDHVSPLPKASRSARWKSVTEDQLKIHTSAGGIFYLRFFCDLKANEGRMDTSLLAIAALEWCHAIVRNRGPQHLAQKLPHFGDGQIELEMGDYLQVVLRGQENHHNGRLEAWVKRAASHVRKPSMHRLTSTGSQVAVDQESMNDSNV